MQFSDIKNFSMRREWMNKNSLYAQNIYIFFYLKSINVIYILSLIKQFFIFISCSVCSFVDYHFSNIRFYCSFNFFIFYFETPKLNMFGMLSIPLFISLLPNSDPIAFEHSSSPTFAKFEANPLPF